MCIEPSVISALFVLEDFAAKSYATRLATFACSIYADNTPRRNTIGSFWNNIGPTS